MSHEEAKPELMVTDASILVLAQKVEGIVSDIGEIKENLKMVPSLAIRIGSIEKDVSLAHDKTDASAKAIEEIKTAVSGLREIVGSTGRTWKVLCGLATAFSVVIGLFYAQWHPWTDDIGKARDARTVELSALKDKLQATQNQTDARLAVLEFRANNLDGKASR